MNRSLGFAVATVGLVTMVVGVAGANVVLLRSLPKLSKRRLIRAEPTVAFGFTLWLLGCDWKPVRQASNAMMS